MADLVGEAFVRITADTTAMRQAIRRDGARTGKEWLNSFTKEVESVSEERLRGARRRLAAGIVDPKELDRLAKSYDGVADAADGFREMLNDLYKQKRLNKGALDQYTVAINKWEKGRIKANAAEAEALRLANLERETMTVRTKQLNNFFSLQKQNLVQVTRLQREQAKAAEASRRAAQRAGTAIEEHSSVFVTRSRYVMAGLDNMSAKTDRFTFVIGQAFGKGSRNNFVNWVGSMVGGMLRLSTLVVTFPLKALAHITNTFGTAFSAARVDGLGKLASAGRGLLSVFGGKGGLVGAVAGLAVGLVGFAKFLPGIISLLSMLAGVVSALVGSIGIGLTGALFALVPALAGGVAGLGAFIGVFTQFFKDEKNEKFVERLFKPFRDMNKSYYPEVRKFLTNISRGFDDIVKDIRPSLDRFFSTFDKRINDPATQRGLTKMSDSMGRIATAFSGASTSFLSGLVGFFEPVLPYAERLARYVERIAGQFDKWASSPEGQSSIAEFMDKAWIAADKVWRILGNIGGIIGDIFMGGNETGTSFLDGILTKLQELNTFLDTPRGRKAMEDWFGDVKSIGEDLGGLVTDVGNLIKNLNSPEARSNAQDIMNTVRAIGDAAVSISSVADDIERIIDALTAPIPKGIAAIFGAIGGNGKPTPSGSGGLYPGAGAPTPAPSTGTGGSGFPVVSIPKETRDSITELKSLKDQLKAYKVTIDVNDTYWRQQKVAIDNFVFRDKQIPVKGNETLWNATKGTVAGYVFDPKTVLITANASPVKAAVDKVKAWLATLPNSKTIRIAGVNSVGGLTMAQGGVLYGPHRILAGEAGPEAVVPLNRPLHMVDPAVRALSAIAQGKTTTPGMAGGGVVGTAGRSITVHEGAIVVMSPHADGRIVAEQALDRLVSFAG